MKKLFGKVGNVLSITVVVIEIAVIAILLVTKISGNIPMLFGHHVFVIRTGSMEPELNIDDVIISRQYKGEDLVAGDVVTYIGKEGVMKGQPVTHEVVRVDGNTVVTKGVANPTEDKPITRSDIVSVMVYKTVVLDKIYRVLNSTPGFICLIVLPLTAMIVAEIIGTVREIKKEGERTDEENKSIQ